MVTITGQAGIGKTRLALAAALRSSHRFLETCTSSISSAPKILRMSPPGSPRLWASPASTISKPALRDSSFLTVAGIATCREIVKSPIGESFTIVATSRIPLGVRDEHVVRLLSAFVCRTRPSLAFGGSGTSPVVVDLRDEPDFMFAELRDRAGASGQQDCSANDYRLKRASFSRDPGVSHATRRQSRIHWMGGIAALNSGGAATSAVKTPAGRPSLFGRNVITVIQSCRIDIKQYKVMNIFLAFWRRVGMKVWQIPPSRSRDASGPAADSRSPRSSWHTTSLGHRRQGRSNALEPAPAGIWKRSRPPSR